MLFGRQPILWVGIVASLVVTVVTQLSGPGIIDTTHPAQTAINVITILGPIISAFIGRYFVTPVASPVLSAGTAVTTPAGDAASVVATVPAP